MSTQEAERLGWIISDARSTPYFTKKLNPAKMYFAKLGLGPDSPTWIFVYHDSEEPAFQSNGHRPGATSEVFARDAVHVLAQDRGRMATTEDIEAFRMRQCGSEELCRVMTEQSKGESSLRLSSAFEKAAAKLGPNPTK